jgi:hypothetical protein
MKARKADMARSNADYALNLLAGEIVEVRTQEEILATLDEMGTLDSMPFMPEMLQYCGRRFRVFKTAHKTCDNIKPWNMRRVKNAVHLTDVRCDGKAHGGCDAGCLIFWNEAWLKRTPDESQAGVKITLNAPTRPAVPSTMPACELSTLHDATRKGADPALGEVIYSCQATKLREFTSALPWWNVWQYIRDITSGNLRRGTGQSQSEKLLETMLSCLELLRSLLIEVFNKVQEFRSGVRYPHIEGTLSTTPSVELTLQPGEFVQVKTKDEILSTLDRRNRNRGLLFDTEMIRYCGGTFRVLKRVHQIVDEKNGKMMAMKSPCIILEGSACVSEYHRHCPRAIYHYWREAWLDRAQ